MRRQGQYADPGAYVGAQMQHISAQSMENRSGSDHFQGRLEVFTPERDQHPYAASKVEGQWRWERDESKLSNPMASRILAEGQRVDAPRSFFQGKGPGQDAKLDLDKQIISDPRFGPHDDNRQIGFEDKHLVQKFENVEQKFLDNIIKLAKEQSDAEDAENARHREKINAINTQYQEQLEALRARHAGRRDEFLRKEAHSRQLQYEQAMRDHFPSSSDPLGYSGIAHRPYTTESYGEQARFVGGFEARGQYHAGRTYDTAPRYY